MHAYIHTGIHTYMHTYIHEYMCAHQMHAIAMRRLQHLSLQLLSPALQGGLRFHYFFIDNKINKTLSSVQIPEEQKGEEEEEIFSMLNTVE
jgi:hypothetical protein